MSSAAPTSDRDAAPEGAPEPTARQRPVRIDNDREIPPVQDETGERVGELFQTFLETFRTSEEGASASGEEVTSLFYIDQLRSLQEFRLTTLYVDYTHLLQSKQVLAKAISEQYYRFLPYLRLALQALVKKYTPQYLYLNSHTASSTSSGLAIRAFQIAFYNLPIVQGIRSLRTEAIGRLTSVSGTVTRTSEVRPELTSGTFTCMECKGIVRDVEQQFKYTEPNMCPNLTCSNRVNWILDVPQSKFTDWQKVRIQENPNEIPTGSMPRSLDIILRGEIVERAKAGDKCIFTGAFIVVPDVSVLGLPGVNAEIMRETSGRGTGGVGAMGVGGLKALGVRDLTYKTAFLACMCASSETRTNVTNIRGSEDGDQNSRREFLSSLTPEEINQLLVMVKADHIYSRLVNSIAPTVYGHDIIKKGILLQLMGGVHKTTAEGMNLRGDLNVCIVGDPSTSKSQFLKYVCSFLPRAVYTSGKASSAAGLTAAVVKDEETGEFTIEAGALMLADNGICAIDEFDKMDISDQVAIHEAMEQQTISIAKAGIQATLNARTSILAAANPIGGRYNRKISLRQNVAMTPPIMSRFDLFFVVLDEGKAEVDRELARHIVNIHRFKNLALQPEYSTEELQRYIRYARTFNPKLTPESSAVLCEKYRELRAGDMGYGRSSYRVTVRQLESMIRLSEAIARTHCSDIITPAMVKEAHLLLSQSIIHVEKDAVQLDSEGEDEENEQQPAESPQLRQHTPGTPVPAPTQPSSSKKFTITYDKYMTMMQKMVLHIAETERNTGNGLRKSDVVAFYLESVETEISDMEELEQETGLVHKVLKRLVKEKYLIELRGEKEELEDEETEDEPILCVHPDCDIAS